MLLYSYHIYIHMYMHMIFKGKCFSFVPFFLDYLLLLFSFVNECVFGYPYFYNYF